MWLEGIIEDEFDILNIEYQQSGNRDCFNGDGVGSLQLEDLAEISFQ